ncbi:hypothetical protein FB45DRAFT_1095809 [Roridomyces roridus]|uniref:Uncharacterized protein n=1 Tax=Roridomyces roridus TaxID=1738132 RepID=A0AAD7BFN7_9AGAR|nr:hypothetical protein FB45DRAFT_1095809 [Roridomyces roridus]
MSRILEGKIVLVTGGASGLGKAIAKACLDNKAKVVLADINDELATQTTIELRQICACPPDYITSTTLDVPDESSAAAAVEFSVRLFGRLDVLVNNAGIFDGFHGAATCEKEVWDRILRVDLTGAFLMTKYAVQHFLGRGDGKPSSGSIVNIGSTASTRGALAGVAYTTAKHGLIGLTKNTAAVYATQGIRTNIILPGGMHTSIQSSMPKDVSAEGVAISQQVVDIPVGVYLDVDVVAATVVFVASDSGAGMNGAIVDVDNGLNAF